MAKILVVDDASVMRKNLEVILNNAGHQVVAEAKNGKIAYQRYKAYQPDLVTMDITMPEMTGIEAAKKIVDQFPKAKIIMISTIDKKREVFRALKAGATDYLIKPIKEKTVISKIEKVLATDITEEREEVNKQDNSSSNLDLSIRSFIANSSQGFIIKNDAQQFKIIMHPTFNQDSLDKLDTAITGLSFVQPLRVFFDCSSIKTLEQEFLAGLNRLARQINEVNGQVEAEFSDYLLDKIKTEDFDTLQKLI